MAIFDTDDGKSGDGLIAVVRKGHVDQELSDLQQQNIELRKEVEQLRKKNVVLQQKLQALETTMFEEVDFRVKELECKHSHDQRNTDRRYRLLEEENETLKRENDELRAINRVLVDKVARLEHEMDALRVTNANINRFMQLRAYADQAEARALLQILDGILSKPERPTTLSSLYTLLFDENKARAYHRALWASWQKMDANVIAAVRSNFEAFLDTNPSMMEAIRECKQGGTDISHPSKLIDAKVLQSAFPMTDPHRQHVDLIVRFLGL